MPIIPKNQMTEEDVKLNYITPAIQSRGWMNKLTMETSVKFTDGKINLKGNMVSRAAPKRRIISFTSEELLPLCERLK